MGKATLANGLAVPHPIGEALMLNVLHDTSGTAIAVSEEDMLVGVT